MTIIMLNITYKIISTEKRKRYSLY